jgi:hypothetical protein
VILGLLLQVIDVGEQSFFLEPFELFICVGNSFFVHKTPVIA